MYFFHQFSHHDTVIILKKYQKVTISTNKYMLDTYLVHSFYFQGKKPSYKKENNNKNIFYWWRPSKKCFHFFAFYIFDWMIFKVFFVFFVDQLVKESIWGGGRGAYLTNQDLHILQQNLIQGILIYTWNVKSSIEPLMFQRSTCIFFYNLF